MIAPGRSSSLATIDRLDPATGTTQRAFELEGTKINDHRMDMERINLPDMRYRLIMRFTDYADPAVPYMYHCHLLWHEDQGMMGQFVVVAPGADPAPTHDHHSH
jgi:FtsP/CotA-like multicopper oxidase with cupredoxin domain